MEAIRDVSFATQFYANQTAEWQEKYCDYAALSELVNRIKQKPNKETVGLLHGDGPSTINEAIDRFTGEFQKEADKVAEFYHKKLQEYQERFEKLNHMASKMQRQSLSKPNYHESIQEEETEHQPEVLSLRQRRKKKKLLTKGISQLYRGLLMLYNFALLNNTAFVNLIKDFERISPTEDVDLFIVIRQRSFAKAVDTKRLKHACESLYASFTGNSDISKAKQELSSRRHDKRDINMYLIGFFFGISCPFLVLWLLSGILTYYKVDTIASTFLALLPVFRLVWIPTLGLWMYGLDTLLWHRARINYQFIFEYDPKTALGYRSVFLMAALFLSIFSTFLFLGYNYIVDLFTFPWVSQEVGLWLWPTIMLVMVFLILLYPFNFFWRSSRICFLKTSLQVFIAPFGKIGFREFFVGDVYTSLVKTMFDTQYTFCYYVTGSFLVEDDSVCVTVNNYLLPFISVAPLYWRLVQCLKRYWKTKEKVHIANALKYGCASLVVLFSTLSGNFQKYDPGYWPPTRILWLISFILSTLYTYSWDVFMDWGLGRVKSKNFLLRDKLVWGGHKWFFWAVTITPFTVIVDMQPEMLNLIAASIEIVRRFTWAILRIENEHLHNCGSFRAVTFIPLPFDVNKTEELEVNEVDHHIPIPSNIIGFGDEEDDGIPIFDSKSSLDLVYGTPVEHPRFYHGRASLKVEKSASDDL